MNLSPLFPWLLLVSRHTCCRCTTKKRPTPSATETTRLYGGLLAQHLLKGYPRKTRFFNILHRFLPGVIKNKNQGAPPVKKSKQHGGAKEKPKDVSCH